MAVTIAPKAPPRSPGSDRAGQPVPAAGQRSRSLPPRLAGADALRALAALAVVVVHTSHWALQDEGAYRAVWHSVTLVARFCVPAFVVLTGLVLAYRYGEQRLGRDFLLRRARRSLVPFLIWAPVFCAVDVFLTGAVGMSWHAVGDWFAGGAGHLYFLILVPQLYLLMLLWPTRRRAATILTAGAVLFQLTLCALRLYVPMPNGAARQAVLVQGFEEFPFWIGYFAIGVLAGRVLARRRGRGIAAWPFALAVAPLTILLLWVDVRGAANGSYTEGTGAFLRPLLMPMTLAICAAAVFGIPKLLRRMPRLDRATALLSRHSLGVYIVHPLLLYWFGRRLYGGLHAHLPLSIAAVLVLTVATAMSALLVSMLLARTPLAVTIGEQWRRQERAAGGVRRGDGELVGRRAA